MKVKLDPGAVMPRKAHETDAGMDLYAIEDIKIQNMKNANVGTGVHIKIPAWMKGSIVGRSGMTKKGLIVPVGTIDAGYTGEIRVTIFNFTGDDFEIHKGDRIAQIVISSIPDLWFEEANDLGETERGDRGFGSTGV